jgi:hypothetical protein
MTSRQVSSLTVRELVIRFFTREESHHWFLKRKVLLSNWKIMKEQLTGVTSITMSVSLYATTSKIIANHVEWQVQLHVRDVLPDNGKLLQVKPGSGGCQGLPPYKVGARFIVHKQDGNLPLGAILKSEIPPGTAHISEKPASKKRSLMDYFKSG